MATLNQKKEEVLRRIRYSNNPELIEDILKLFQNQNVQLSPSGDQDVQQEVGGPVSVNSPCRRGNPVLDPPSFTRSTSFAELAESGQLPVEETGRSEDREDTQEESVPSGCIQPVHTQFRAESGQLPVEETGRSEDREDTQKESESGQLPVEEIGRSEDREDTQEERHEAEPTPKIPISESRERGRARLVSNSLPLSNPPVPLVLPKLSTLARDQGKDSGATPHPQTQNTDHGLRKELFEGSLALFAEKQMDEKDILMDIDKCKILNQLKFPRDQYESVTLSYAEVLQSREKCRELLEDVCFPKERQEPGLAVLFFNKFAGDLGDLKERPFVDADHNNLKECLNQNGYTVFCFLKFTRDTFHEELKNVVQKVEPKHTGILIFISSHGGCDEKGTLIYDADGSIIHFIDIQEMLYGTLGKCKALEGKPKNIIVQACRGTAFHEATDTSPADFTFCFSSMPGYFSFTQKSGSIYVKKLCDGFNNHKTDDIVQLMRTVNKSFIQVTGNFKGINVRPYPQMEVNIVINPQLSIEK